MAGSFSIPKQQTAHVVVDKGIPNRRPAVLNANEIWDSSHLSDYVSRPELHGQDGLIGRTDDL